jgi:hypothetical protein
MEYTQNIAPQPEPRATRSAPNSGKIETGMGPITDKIINEFINGISIDNYESRINDKVLDPITKLINKKMQPYMYLSGGLYIVIILLLLIIIYMLFTKKK